MQENINNIIEENQSDIKQETSVAENATNVLPIDELQKQLDNYKDLLLRKAAEFDNYKRRVENETSNMLKYANESLIEDILPVLDDFELSLKHSKDNKDYDAFVKGIELIYQKFKNILETRGVKPFDTIGKEFNVDYHDALMQMPKEGVAPNIVIDEVQKGYMLNDKVLRHAKVIVSATENDSKEK